MTTHPVHRRIALHQVLLQRTFPWRTALIPLNVFIKGWLGRGSRSNLWQALSHTGISMAHCYPRRNDIIWASSQRSGHNWLAMIYTIIAEEVFNNRQIVLDDIPDYRPRVYRHVRVRFDMNDHLTCFYDHLPIPRLLHTHDMYFRVYKNRKILVQVRHPKDVLMSHYYHAGYFEDMSFLDYLDHKSVRRRIEFFNTWGQALNEAEEIYCLRFEDLRDKPLEAIRGVLNYFNFPQVEDAVIQHALDETHIEKVKAWERSRWKVEDDRKLHFARSGTSGQSRELTPAEQEKLHTLLAKRIKHTFGYAL